MTDMGVGSIGAAGGLGASGAATSLGGTGLASGVGGTGSGPSADASAISSASGGLNNTLGGTSLASNGGASPPGASNLAAQQNQPLNPNDCLKPGPAQDAINCMSGAGKHNDFLKGVGDSAKDAGPLTPKPPAPTWENSFPDYYDRLKKIGPDKELVHNPQV